MPLLNLSSSPTEEVTEDEMGPERLAGRNWSWRRGPTRLAHLIRWIFHLLHVPPNHILGILTCRDSGMYLRKSRDGEVSGRRGLN